MVKLNLKQLAELDAAGRIVIFKRINKPVTLKNGKYYDTRGGALFNPYGRVGDVGRVHRDSNLTAVTKSIYPCPISNGVARRIELEVVCD